VGVVCCQVEVSASGRSLDHRSPSECCVSEYDREASITRRSWPTVGCHVIKKDDRKRLSTHESHIPNQLFAMFVDLPLSPATCA